jgi:hypothetical protein
MSLEIDRGRNMGVTIVLLASAEPAKRLRFDFLGLRASLVVAIVELLLRLLD